MTTSDEIDDEEEPLHPPLEGEYLTTALEAYNRLETVLPVEPEEWVDGFRFEADLGQEVALWDHISKLFQQIISEFPGIDLAQKQRILHLLLYCSTTQKENVLSQFPGDDFLNRHQIEMIVNRYFSAETD